MARKVSMKDGRLVYSTESGEICPGCSRAVAECICNQEGAVSPSDGYVRLMRETKGRAGKGVVLISGIPRNGIELKKLAKALKQKCGSGGSVKNGVIEIQGDHRDRLEKELTDRGYKVKRAGG